MKPSDGLEPSTPSLPWQSDFGSVCRFASKSACTGAETAKRCARRRLQQSALFCTLRYPLGTRPPGTGQRRRRSSMEPIPGRQNLEPATARPTTGVKRLRGAASTP
jgi:hypothetical protein